VKASLHLRQGWARRIESFLRAPIRSALVRGGQRWRQWFGQQTELPEHLQRGSSGEAAARIHLIAAGLHFLTANYRSDHGEIDLIFRDDGCLVFVEVKTRSSEEWARPAAAVNASKRRRLSLTAEHYLRSLDDRRVKFRFDVVEVLLDEGGVCEVRHVANAFALNTRRLRSWRR
jgi:putative endonuclease